MVMDLILMKCKISLIPIKRKLSQEPVRGDYPLNTLICSPLFDDFRKPYNLIVETTFKSPTARI